MSSPTPPPSCEESSGGCGDNPPLKRPRRTSLDSKAAAGDTSRATNVFEQEHR